MNSIPTFPKAWRIPGLFAFLFLALAAGGCTQTPDAKYWPEFYMENPSPNGVPVEMPLTQVTYHRMGDPFLDGTNISGVELDRVALGYVLAFKLTSKSVNRLYKTTAEYKGEKIFLFVGGKPVGAVLIDPNEPPIADGILHIFPEEILEKDLLPDPKTQAASPFMTGLQDAIEITQKRINAQ